MKSQMVLPSSRCVLGKLVEAYCCSKPTHVKVNNVAILMINLNCNISLSAQSTFLPPKKPACCFIITDKKNLSRVNIGLVELAHSTESYYT